MGADIFLERKLTGCDNIREEKCSRIWEALRVKSVRSH